MDFAAEVERLLYVVKNTFEKGVLMNFRPVGLGVAWVVEGLKSIDFYYIIFASLGLFGGMLLIVWIILGIEGVGGKCGFLFFLLKGLGIVLRN